MTSTHTCSVLRSAAICLAPAIILVLSPVAAEAKKPAAEAKKAKLAAAKKKVAPSPSDTKKAKTTDKPAVAPASAAWEAPPREGETPPPPAPSSPPAAETKPAADSAPAAAAAPAESPAAPSQAEQPPPSPPPPPEEETLPALIPPAPTQYVEHLGPSAYPGRLRGLYGGSLWLEPSFHGLQWPYMTKTGVGVSGSVWVDSGYESITSQSPLVMNATRYLQQARAVLRVTPTYASGRFFIQAQAELVGSGCQSVGSDKECDEKGKSTVVDTDDLWLRVGHWNIWDLKVGRFEGWEIYHTGMGLDINTLERRGALLSTGQAPPDYYGVNFLHDRPKGSGVGYIALHGYPTSFLRMEVLTELGTDKVASTGDNYIGTRPVAILDLGWVKLKGGYEYEKRTRNGQYNNSDPNYGPLGKTDYKYKYTHEGYGGAVQFVLEPYAEFGANIARGSQVYIGDDGTPDDTQNLTWTSVGGFANIRVGSLARLHLLDDLLVGGGLNWTTQYDSHRAGNNSPDYAGHLQAFGAVQYLVAKQLFVKAVIAYARADFQPSGATGDLVYSNVMWSGRVRLMYLY
jgi:hypothetical protein